MILYIYNTGCGRVYRKIQCSIDVHQNFFPPSKKNVLAFIINHEGARATIGLIVR